MYRKRIASLLLAVLSIGMFAQAVHAGGWQTKEIKWQLSNVGTPTNATGIYVRDTLFNVLATGQTDTTATFSLDDADPIPRGVVAPGVINGSLAGATQSDTTVIAYLVMQPDTNAAVTSTLTGVTAIFDGRAVGTGAVTTLARGWVKADSAFVNGAAGATLITGDESVALPIRTISPYGNIRRWQNLRARITCTAGLLSGSVRVYFRYYDADAK
jgi:hypothetical protein